MGLVLGAVTLLVAAPVTAVALHTGGRPLVPGSVRRRGGAPAALLAATTGTLSGAVPKLGSPEQAVTEISVTRAAPQAPRQERVPDGRSRRVRAVSRTRTPRPPPDSAPALLVVVEEGRVEGVAGQLRSRSRSRPSASGRRGSCLRRSRRSRPGRRS